MKIFHRFTSKDLLLFITLILSYVIQLIPNLTSSWLEQTIGKGSSSLLFLIAFLVALAIAFFVVRKLIERATTRKLVLVTREQAPPKFKGLILLVGPGRPDKDPLKDGAEIPAIEYHKPEVLWLIPSRDGVPVANMIREKYEKTIKVLAPITIDNPWNVQESYKAVKQIFATAASEVGLLPSDIIADITGSTHPMAAGMVLACQDSYNMQYMSGKPGTASHPIWIHFTPEPPAGAPVSNRENA